MTLEKLAPFAALSDDAYRALPPVYQLMAEMPSQPITMAACETRKSTQYLCEAPVKPLARNLPQAPARCVS